MIGVGMSTEEIAEALPALHLTVAEATGIAKSRFRGKTQRISTPLTCRKRCPKFWRLSVQKKRHSMVCPQTSMASSVSSQRVRRSNGFERSFQQLMNDTAESIALQRGNLNQRKQELYLALNRYIDNIGSNESIDSNTIDLLVKLEEELVEALPAGTVSKTMSRGEKIASVHNRILISAQEELEALSQLSADLSDAQFTRETYVASPTSCSMRNTVVVKLSSPPSTARSMNSYPKVKPST